MLLGLVGKPIIFDITSIVFISCTFYKIPRFFQSQFSFNIRNHLFIIFFYSAFWYFNIPNEFVINHNFLIAVITTTFGYIDRYFVYELPKKWSSQFCFSTKKECIENFSTFVVVFFLLFDQLLFVKKSHRCFPYGILRRCYRDPL